MDWFEGRSLAVVSWRQIKMAGIVHEAANRRIEDG